MQPDVQEILAACKERISREFIRKPDDEWGSGFNTGLGAALALIASIEAKHPVSPDGCEFCRVFDFSRASTEVNHGFAHILNALCNTQYPRHQQFNYCPVCGKAR